jgi:hypothetical protein
MGFAMVHNLNRNAEVPNDQEVPPNISQISRICAFTAFGAFAVVLSWMAASLLLPWIQTGTPPEPERVPSFVHRHLPMRMSHQSRHPPPAGAG